MQNPSKHDKNNIKTFPVAINIGAGAGAGRFGIGGLVLFGGALITATIVSALAFKTKSQRRSSSENLKKTTSPAPSPEMQSSVDAPNKLEPMMKADKDFSSDSLPLEVQNPRSDEVEIQTKNIQSLIPEEKHNYVQSGDNNEDIIVSVVDEDQENKSVHEELENNSEKIIDLDSDEQVVIMAAQIEEEEEEEDSCLDRDEEMIDNENGEHVDSDSSVSDGDGEGEDHQDNLQEQILEGLIEKDDHDEIINLETSKDLIVHEVVMEEEEEEEEEELAIDATSFLRIEVMEDILGMVDHEVDDHTNKQPSQLLMNKDELVKKDDHVPHAQSVKKDEDHEEDVTINEDTPSSRSMDQEHKDKETTQKVEEHVTMEEDEPEHDQLVKKEDHVPHVQSVKEDEDVSYELEEEVTPEAYMIINNKIEEKQAFVGESWNLKLMRWSMLVSIWCLYHWYSKLPFLELSLVGSLLFILILLGYRNRATNLV